jgi:hypothetical protein
MPNQKRSLVDTSSASCRVKRWKWMTVEHITPPRSGATSSWTSGFHLKKLNAWPYTWTQGGADSTAQEAPRAGPS